MRVDSIAAGLAALAATTVSAVPLTTRAQDMLSTNDMDVVQLALYLEHLEYTLYSGGYEAFTDEQYTAAGLPANFRQQIGITAMQEMTHSEALAGVLTANGVTPIPNCTYKFPYTDPTSFADVTNMVTSVGIGAYLGGAQLITDNPTLLTTAASILSVEARHDSFIRAGLGGKPFPNAFDTALTALWAFNLAQEFIVSCPMQLPVPIGLTLPKLTMTAPAPEPHLQPAVTAGTPLSFTWDPTKFFVAVPEGTQLYLAFVNMSDQKTYFSEVTSTGTGSGTAPVPEGLAGVAFACLTTFSSGLTLEQLSQFGTLAGPAEVVLS